MPSPAADTNVVAAADHSTRNRTVGIAVLVALGIWLLYRFICRREGGKGDAADGDNDGISGRSPRKDSASAPVYGATDRNDPAEESLHKEAADTLRKASEKYDDDYKERMARMVAPTVEERAKPFIGFQLSEDNMEVLAIFEQSPASQVGVDLGHRLVSIAGDAPSDFASLRALVDGRCQPGHITQFVFLDNDGATYEADLWVMTAEERFAGKPYYFDVSQYSIRQ